MAAAIPQPGDHPRPHEIVTLNRLEFQLLHQGLFDGFIITWIGDSHARNIAARHRRRQGPFAVAPTIQFVGRGGRTIRSFLQNDLEEAVGVLPHSPLQRVAIIFLGSNDIDVATWPVGVPKNKFANELLSLRVLLLNSYDHVFVVGIPERTRCRGRNPQLVHQLSLRCNQRLNNALRGWYLKLPNTAYQYDEEHRYHEDGIHFTRQMYDSILRLIQFKIRAVMSGDAGFINIV
ncbi:unnamed protein product [Meganyctiphanes norvegica]|uniref:SGNH hydrolase-type esterase domain-containing protein n=1 Tax=Meganyctiphanes norvegica TaxID=48144 RepID=A0AAV2RXB2_MEGNR